MELEEAAAAAPVEAATATFAPATFSLFASKSHCSLAATERLNGFFPPFLFQSQIVSHNFAVQPSGEQCQAATA